jgi:hypothetical protein
LSGETRTAFHVMSCVALPILLFRAGGPFTPMHACTAEPFTSVGPTQGSRVLGPGIICARTGPLPAGSAMMAKRNGIQISLVFAPIRVGAPDHPSVQPGIRAAESWRGLRFTEFELRRLDAGEKTWTPNARPLLPDQTGHPSLDFPANSRLDLTDSRGLALLHVVAGCNRCNT